jgi:hypothetical protein
MRVSQNQAVLDSDGDELAATAIGWLGWWLVQAQLACLFEQFCKVHLFNVSVGTWLPVMGSGWLGGSGGGSGGWL